MATLVIKEYASTAVGSNGEGTLNTREPHLVKQVLAAPGVSAAFTHGFLQVFADVAFKVTFGAAPASVEANEIAYPANTGIVFCVSIGHKLVWST